MMPASHRSIQSLSREMSFRKVWRMWMVATCITATAAWVSPPACSDSHKMSDIRKTLVLQSSYNENDNGSETQYRSIADVVGGLHGGKYQFGGGGIPDSAFAGHGGTECQSETAPLDDGEELPNWAKRLAPTVSQTTSPPTLSVPSNSNPMDGMVYFASIQIQNQERTWEKFYTKLMTPQADGFVEATVDDVLLTPKSGSLAPRGGASNACDASKPYSDSATIRVTQSATGASSNQDLWLVVGTEEEIWAYKLDLLEY